MFALQVLIVVLLVVAAVTTLVLKGQNDRLQAAGSRSLAAAEAFAHAPGLPAALRAPDPTAILQPLTEDAWMAGGLDFITVMNTDGIRYTSPQPERIGRKFIGTIGPALSGHTTIETVKGPGSGDVQAVVPVMDGGAVVGLVAAGMQADKVSSAISQQLPVIIGAGAAALLLAVAGTALVSRRLLRQTRGLDPAELAQMYEHHDAVLHAVREGVVIVDADNRIRLANDEARRLLDLPPTVEGTPVAELGLDPRIADLLMSHRPASDEVIPVGERLLAVNNRPTRNGASATGSVATLRDSTELRALAGKAETAQSYLRLLSQASVAIGTTLDVTRTAEELTELAADRFADYVTVDLAEPVLRGDEPKSGSYTEAPQLCRVALSGPYPNPLYRVGEVHRYLAVTPMAQGFVHGRSVLVPDLSAATDWLAGDPDRARSALEHGLQSLITVPLQARGVLLGVVNFWRLRSSEPLQEDDVTPAEELAARAAVCIDNARRFTREHAVAVALQRSLLPRELPEQNALDIAHRYLPAQTGVGGDWFDVIPLSGARVALVVGDVVGHGLHAAATMGRLRTAVLNFASLDLPPEELLWHLDELVTRIDRHPDSPDGNGNGDSDDDGPAITGATCLYAVYDPTTGTCTIARAGHPLPALVRPDGTVAFPALPAGPPLGLGGLPFESAELQLAEGSSLVLYTDGLIEDRERPITTGLALLGTALAGPSRTPEQLCESVLDALLPTPQRDDIALLVARTHLMAADRIAAWEVPGDPSAVAAVRTEAAAHLARWGLAEAVFTTELVLSELVTNAIRYGSGPIRVRLLYDRALICEVSDGSSTSPHLRYAADEDEGGRGLFLIAQLTDRWGTRYHARGKTIWSEQSIG
ncbi:SpoIIE family protein phosphatase [Kitasatospora kifunensis]|uniref:Serine phosphatase RsbU (Regulator of sigma subunit)/PAS domain-containing protein/anti-sigma regulatory factor (Ser/Thr protein kinase) n=1 Tax=Kitasatospora kifunensis TaxID=58351 RepID=A0A7W7R935_KITKI|nr:SpoIIE family protein phosphatase [Kitasatospora kifunensis]MBB4927574.1 serine phosphatase RsbU (regulator of sigma subunit)/PAS domain-containing protein/anti-sigma regulatory factor (Ser/Thr protein kinase) [Kitasatospora kifunensis]